ncbi:uncharacterized protein [Eurosta solidaginis]|uniref:uncharacterized protein n=1 Tax=Eurosta solidaginis TaxID=178769 RepID=UPI00353102EC
MPLVKVIGPQPDTATAAAAITDIELTIQNQVKPESDQIPASSPPPRPQQELYSGTPSGIQLRFWPKLAQHHEENDDAPEGVRVTRLKHGSFLFTLHAHAIGYFVFAVTQWTLLYYVEGLVMFVKTYYYLSLIPFVLSFVMLIALIIFYNNLINTRRKAMFYLYTAIKLQLATVIIALPISTSTFNHLLFSSIITVIVIAVSIVMALNRRDFYLHAPQYIIAWTFRCFIGASVGIITALSVKSPHFDVIMTLIMGFFILVFILICGKTLSRTEFIWLDKHGPHLYGSLFYLNYIILFSMCVQFFKELDEALRL